MRGSLSAINIPIHAVSIEKLEYIHKNSHWEGGCLLFHFTHHTGYGYVGFAGRQWPAHRLVKTISVGVNKPGMVIDHTCGTKNCINVAHLEFVTQSENVRRGTAWHHIAEKARNRTHCRRGHELTAGNTYMWGTGRYCRECRYQYYYVIKSRKGRK